MKLSTILLCCNAVSLTLAGGWMIFAKCEHLEKELEEKAYPFEKAAEIRNEQSRLRKKGGLLFIVAFVSLLLAFL